MTIKERMKNLARALQLTPTDRIDVRQRKYSNQWWLSGCIEGDQPLPRTTGCHTVTEAIEAAEAWLGPELMEDPSDEQKAEQLKEENRELRKTLFGVQEQRDAAINREEKLRQRLHEELKESTEPYDYEKTQLEAIIKRDEWVTQLFKKLTMHCPDPTCESNAIRDTDTPCPVCNDSKEVTVEDAIRGLFRIAYTSYCSQIEAEERYDELVKAVNDINLKFAKLKRPTS